LEIGRNKADFRRAANKSFPARGRADRLHPASELPDATAGQDFPAE
jgi:hypothetical protein